jgi:hypothetical protein
MSGVSPLTHSQIQTDVVAGTDLAAEALGDMELNRWGQPHGA